MPRRVTVRLRVRRGAGVRPLVEGRGSANRPIISAAMTLIDETSHIRRLEAAADPETSSWQLAALADDSEPDVRMAVAANPSTSMLTVMRLQRDDDPGVRAIVSARQGISA